MKSVGETMAIGRTFQEALQKGLRSLEIDRYGLGGDGHDKIVPERLRERLITPHPERIFYIRYAFQTGMSVEQVAALTQIDPWFLAEIEELVNLEGRLRAFSLETLPRALLWQAKRAGFSDVQLSHLLGVQRLAGDRYILPDRAAALKSLQGMLVAGKADTGGWVHPGEERPYIRADSLPDGVLAELLVCQRRKQLGIRAVYNLVDTCAAEFEAYTPYLYSTYETTCEANPSQRQKVMILGGGPNRIGQGIEFDYCCVHAAFGLRDMGIQTIMVNCNPETVSTDYDTSDRLYFEPLTLEDVLNIVDVEKPDGVLVQFGGQTPLKLARALEATGVPIWGTSPDSIDLA